MKAFNGKNVPFELRLPVAAYEETLPRYRSEHKIVVKTHQPNQFYPYKEFFQTILHLSDFLCASKKRFSHPSVILQNDYNNAVFTTKLHSNTFIFPLPLTHNPNHLQQFNIIFLLFKDKRFSLPAEILCL
jgi:hypothetical protein